jgi:hypothetical protein
MSAYGPALFIVRHDKQDMPKGEQTKLIALVKKHAKALRCHNVDGGAVRPSIYDYGQYEEKGLGVLLYSTYLFEMMPDDIRKEHEDAAAADALKIGSAIDKEQPGIYRFKASFVEV